MPLFETAPRTGRTVAEEAEDAAGAVATEEPSPSQGPPKKQRTADAAVNDADAAVNDSDAAVNDSEEEKGRAAEEKSS